MSPIYSRLEQAGLLISPNVGIIYSIENLANDYKWFSYNEWCGLDSRNVIQLKKDPVSIERNSHEQIVNYDNLKRRKQRNSNLVLASIIKSNEHLYHLQRRQLLRCFRLDDTILFCGPSSSFTRLHLP